MEVEIITIDINTYYQDLDMYTCKAHIQLTSKGGQPTDSLAYYLIYAVGHSDTFVLDVVMLKDI